MPRKTRRPIPRSRRLYFRRRPLSATTRRCGRAGVAQAKSALEHREDGPEPDEQLVLDLPQAEARNEQTRG